MDFEKFWRRHRLVTDTVSGIAISVCLVSSLGAQESSGDGVALLDEFTRSVSSLTTAFRQTLYDSNGQPLETETATGQFSFLRPDRFRWHQELPFEQTIVANGESLWMYDVEFEQVELSPYSNIAGTPAALLSGEGNIADRFQVHELPAEDDLRLLSLLPLEADTSEFESVSIYFDEDTPVRLELLDNLGQLTRVEFFDVEVNPDIPAQDFDFIAPDGVRVVAGAN